MTVPGMVVHDCNPRTGEVEAKEYQVQGLDWIHGSRSRALSSKYEALNSIPSTAYKKEGRKERKKGKNLPGLHSETQSEK
jgi:hypothetical protein